MSVKFFTVKGKAKTTNIYVRFWHGRQYDFKANTQIKVFADDFSNARQRMKNKAQSRNKDLINSTLSALETELLEQWQTDTINKVSISKDWLKNTVNTFFGRANKDQSFKIYFADWVQKFIDDSPNRLRRGKPLKLRTIQHYQTTLNKVKEFEQYQKTRLKHTDISLKFYNSFVNYCRNIAQMSDNTIGKYIGDIKLFCKSIELENLPINKQFRHSDFTTITGKTHDIYLTDSEINKIFDFDFSNSIALSNARDLFIIGLRTGLRISDFMRLKQTDIKEDFITIETKKTGQTVVIPMHQQIRAILHQNNGNLPYKIADQKFNKYIKQICKKVGISEMVTGSKLVNINPKGQPKKWRYKVGKYPKYELVKSHTCRRSFASNLYGKLPNLTIMAITGHTRETTFLSYIKVTPKENAERLKALFDKEQKETKTTILKAVK